MEAINLLGHPSHGRLDAVCFRGGMFQDEISGWIKNCKTQYQNIYYYLFHVYV